MKPKYPLSKFAIGKEYPCSLEEKIKQIERDGVWNARKLNEQSRRGCIEMATTIVKIRRRIKLKENLDWFFGETRGKKIKWYCDNLPLIWIDSICVTFADHGTPKEKIGGAAISLFLKVTKLIEIERIISPVDPQPLLWTKASTLLYGPKEGVHRAGVFGPKVHELGGDFTNDMLCRLGKSLKPTPYLQKIFVHAIGILMKNNTWLARQKDYDWDEKSLSRGVIKRHSR